MRVGFAELAIALLALTGLVLLIVLIYRRRLKRICRQCLNPVPGREDFCVYCGKSFRLVPRWAKWVSASVILFIELAALIILLLPSLHTSSPSTRTDHVLTMAMDDATHGSTDPAAGAHTFGEGQVVTITAVPASGWSFDHLSGDVVAANTSTTTTVTMNASKTVTAHFVAYYGTATYSVGRSPFGIAFDGTNIWVANAGSNTVTKLNASDGSLVNTYSAGSSPWGLAFDGTNIWVANYYSNNVTKLKASDGSLVGTYSVGPGPVGIAFDGTNIWVANWGEGYGNTVTKMDASDASVAGTYSVGPGPVGIAFDGANIWVANWGSNSVTKIS